jgi:hypothetical protein
VNESVAEALRLMRQNALKAVEYARENPNWPTKDLVVDAIANVWSRSPRSLPC